MSHFSAKQWILGLLLLAGLGSGCGGDSLSRQGTANRTAWDDLSKACDACWSPGEGDEDGCYTVNRLSACEQQDVPRGLYALAPWPSDARIDPDVFAQDIVQGVTVRVYWKDIETAPGVYDWSKLDDHFRLARTLDKQVRLAMGSGAYSPLWLIGQEVDGSTTYEDTCTTEGAHEDSAWGVETFCAEVPNGEYAELVRAFPVPWDLTHYRRWLKFLDALVNHLEENGGRDLERLAWIAVTGPNGHNGEVSHPTADWLNLGLRDPEYDQFILTTDQLLDALTFTWTRAIDDFDRLFGARGVHYTLSLVLRSFPMGKGNSDHDEVFKNRLLAHRDAVLYPDAFGLQSNGLDPRYSWAETEAWPGTKDHWFHLRDLAGENGSLTGMQSRGMKRLYDTDKDGTLSEQELSACARGAAWKIMADNVRCLQADFVEVYGSDLKVAWDDSCDGGIRRELEDLSSWLTR